MIKIVRGAVCAQNTTESISQSATELIAEIISRNRLDKSAISAIFFTATADLDAANPATAVRKALELNDVAFMCAQEMAVVGALPRCIRVAVFVQIEPDATDAPLVPVYLGKAATLRPDLR